MSETRAPQSKPNGALHASQAAGAVQERHSDKTKSPSPARRQPNDESGKLAPFAGEEVPPSNGQMWPLHSVAWFHPELKPRRPDSGDLSIESHRTFAPPGFLCPEVTPADQVHTSDEVCDPLPPAVEHQVPRSGLDPFGWDARASVLSNDVNAAKHSASPSEERGRR
jgi:hypothetical protein